MESIVDRLGPLDRAMEPFQAGRFHTEIATEIRGHRDSSAQMRPGTTASTNQKKYSNDVPKNGS